MATSTKTNPSLWKRIVSQVKSGSKGGDSGEWSGRKAQLAVKKYKAAGGGYKGSKSSKNSLSKWSKQKWRTSDGSNSEGKKRYLPDKAWKSLSKGEKSAANSSKKLETVKVSRMFLYLKRLARK